MSTDKMSGRGKHRGKRGVNHHTLSSVARETALSLPWNSPVLDVFKAAALKLNDRHDRHERLVKLSRDITIESKRIIFLLHSAITKESSKEAVTEANERLQKLVKGPFQKIALELKNVPAYLHSRAVTAGFQEYVEAKALCFLVDNQLPISYAEVILDLGFHTADELKPTVKDMLTQDDYMLGLADLTGELMRKAINSISSGDSAECFVYCQIVRQLYTGYLGVTGCSRDLIRKLYTTRRNVEKVEAAVYALCVRGGEAPPALLAAEQPPWDPVPAHSDDEGFY